VKRDLKKAFGKVIKELREDEGLSQQELADTAGIDRSYLSDLERGLNFPSLNIVYSLAEVFKMKANELVQKVDKEMGM
jgi:transcriptional regulator with XRE-family HTH domain